MAFTEIALEEAMQRMQAIRNIRNSFMVTVWISVVAITISAASMGLSLPSIASIVTSVVMMGVVIPLFLSSMSDKYARREYVELLVTAAMTEFMEENLRSDTLILDCDHGYELMTMLYRDTNLEPEEMYRGISDASVRLGTDIFLRARGRACGIILNMAPIRQSDTMKGTKALVTMLERKGVDTVFGYPGGSVIPIYDELYDSNLRHILVRHEQCAAHMADGYARASGRPGVCLATSGPGATNLVTGIATAYADSVPMIALTGQVGVGSLGLGAFQEVDAYSLLMPITKHNFRVLDVNRLPHAVKEAWEICQTGRPGPVHIDMPVDQMNASIDESLLDEKYYTKPPAEDLSALEEAVQWIREAKRPVILCGGGAINASDEVMALSRRLGAPVDTTLMGMGVVPSSYELAMGPLGMHGRLAALEMMNSADLIISIGSRFADRTYGKRCRMQDPAGRVVHIDIDATEFGKHGHPSANLQCDCAKAVRMILERLGTASVSGDWTARAKDAKHRCACDPVPGSVPIAPQTVMHELNAILDEDTIVTTDVGQNQMWAMHFLNIERPRQLLSSGTFGTMGYGLPSAIGAKAAMPDKHVIAITGDGGFQMVMQEMTTSIAEDLPVTVVLLNNGTLGMVRQWQKLFWNERYSATTLKCDPDFVKMAEAFGAEGIRVERPGEIGDALRKARDCGRSCIVEIMVDPEEHALPMIPADPNAAMVRGRCGYVLPQ